nr:hypothetical protein [uncultured Desulfobacter sp.]
MSALSGHELFRIWEAGRSIPPYHRALLLVAAGENTTVEDIAALPVGMRDTRLLALREGIFGPKMRCLADCPACREMLEFSINTTELRASAGDLPSEALQLEMDGYTVEFRVPTSRDLISLYDQEKSQKRNSRTLQHQLLQRCLLSAGCGSGQIPFENLPSQVCEAVIARIEAADPNADIQLALSCPACAHRWQALFDIVSYFWNEIHNWALGLVRDVHVLASTYGWHEADILAMSPFRRNLYLELIGT